MGVVSWIFSNKLLTFFFLTTVAFGIATIVLAVDNSTLSGDLDTCNDRADNQTPTQAPGETTPTTEDPQDPPVTEPPEDMTDYVLPKNVLPNSYDLYLFPDLQTGNFDGNVTINVSVTEATNVIKLHSNGLTVRELRVEGTLSTFQMDADHELIVIQTVDALPVGVGSITIEFTGDMKNRIVGLYQSTYTAEDGTTRAMATSKFEPTYARQAYPCFDEPNMKATFTVHLLRPDLPNYIALSNMRQVNEEPYEGGFLVHFEESVKMSTYLSCFIVSDFNYTETTLSNGMPFKVYATPAQVEKTEYAVEVGSKVIEYYIDYFGIDFPLPKLDLAAIPDFVSGAMEHWGLVTFRETNLLYDPTISSTSTKQGIAAVIAHELAHSWFGNLVTMDWWSDLWLNEGFASYIEYKGVDYVEPDWQMLDQFLVSDLHPVLVLDATLGSHPIVQTVTTPDEITEIFDTISYNKGAAVLRMLEQAVGEETFKNGVTAYLNAHEYGNAVTQDLLDELQRIHGDNLNITQFMNTWTQQMGYPIVDVRTEGNNYVLTQRRYLTDSENEGRETPSPYDYKWDIPITYITNENQDVPTLVWFKHTDAQIAIPVPSTATWVKFNHHQIGYYRVNYEREYWDTLAEHIGHMSISDKTHLLEETFRIAESGQLSYEVPLSLSKYLKDEDNYVPWNVASTMFNKLKDYLSTSEVSTEFREYVIDLVSTAYNRLTWTEGELDTHLQRRARVTVLDVACSMGHVDCLNQAQTLFQNFITTSTPLSQDLRALVYNYGMAASSKTYWDRMWEKFVVETDAAEKLKLLRGLASINDHSLLTRLIDLAKDETYIRSQDYFTCLQYIAANPIGKPIVWDYVRENWPALVDRFTLNDRYLGRMITSVTSGFTTNVKFEEMQAFFGKYPEAGAGAASRVTALETVNNNIRWLAKNKEAVERWIEANVDVNRV